jgi:hypothetical protein
MQEPSFSFFPARPPGRYDGMENVGLAAGMSERFPLTEGVSPAGVCCMVYSFALCVLRNCLWAAFSRWGGPLSR